MREGSVDMYIRAIQANMSEQERAEYDAQLREADRALDAEIEAYRANIMPSAEQPAEEAAHVMPSDPLAWLDEPLTDEERILAGLPPAGE